MTRVVVVSLLLALLMVTAGCSALPGGDPAATPTPSGSGGDGASGGGGSGSDGGSGNDVVDDFEDIQNEAQMVDYIDRSPATVYRPGERFVYEGQTGAGTGFESMEPLTMTIESGNGGEWLDADIEVTLLRGPNETVFTEEDGAMMFNPEMTFMTTSRTWIWLYRYNQVTEIQPRVSSLSVGDTWSYEANTEEGEPRSGFDFEVTKTGTYAGVDCKYVVAESYTGDDRHVMHETCVAPDVGLPAYFAQYNNDGELMMELELVEYSR